MKYLQLRFSSKDLVSLIVTPLNVTMVLFDGKKFSVLFDLLSHFCLGSSNSVSLLLSIFNIGNKLLLRLIGCFMIDLTAYQLNAKKILAKYFAPCFSVV